MLSTADSDGSGENGTIVYRSNLGDVMTKFADLNPRAECGIRLHSMSRIEVPPTYGTLESFVVALSGYVRDRAEKAVAALRAEIARLTALTNA
jgi:hypothetical protein